MQGLWALQSGQFGSKIKVAKNMRRKVVQEDHSSTVQKTAGKNTKYSRNEPILKIGNFARAIVFAKWSVWVEN